MNWTAIYRESAVVPPVGNIRHDGDHPINLKLPSIDPRCIKHQPWWEKFLNWKYMPRLLCGQNLKSVRTWINNAKIDHGCHNIYRTTPRMQILQQTTWTHNAKINISLNKHHEHTWCQNSRSRIGCNAKIVEAEKDKHLRNEATWSTNPQEQQPIHCRQKSTTNHQSGEQTLTHLCETGQNRPR